MRSKDGVHPKQHHGGVDVAGSGTIFALLDDDNADTQEEGIEDTYLYFFTPKMDISRKIRCGQRYTIPLQWSPPGLDRMSYPVTKLGFCCSSVAG